MAITKDQLAFDTYYTGGVPQPRFEESEFPCPQCGSPALRDEFPPNYWSMSGSWDGSWHTDGNQKYVCLHCAISFVDHYVDDCRYADTHVLDTSKGHVTGFPVNPVKQIINEIHEIEDVIPLVERDGKFLTPHDVWRDDYEREHGEKPLDAWG